MAKTPNTAARLDSVSDRAVPLDEPRQPQRAPEWPKAPPSDAAGQSEFTTRQLSDSELVFPSGAPALPPVIERSATAPEGPLVDLLLRNRGALREKLNEHGALLFRGFNVSAPDDFEADMYALGLSPSREYPFGVSPRPNVEKSIHKSTEYADFLVIPPHTEMAYAHRRASWISFWAKQPPEQYGETPLFDMSLVLERLPDDLRERLMTMTMRYVRYIRNKKAMVTFERTIEETFETTDPARIEAICAELGIDCEWVDGKFLKATTELPAVMNHPVTGRASLNAQFINGFVLIEGIRRIRERYALPVRMFFEWYIRKQFKKPTVHYRSMPAEGPDFTPQEQETIANALYDSSTIFRWQQDDVLVIDNIRTAHGRLNVKGERSILTCLGDFYTT